MNYGSGTEAGVSRRLAHKGAVISWKPDRPTSE